MLVLVSLGSTTRRPALADEPTPASVFERTSAAANQTSAEAKKTSDSLKAYQDRLKHAQAEAAAAGSALSNALGADPAPPAQQTLKDIPEFRSAVRQPVPTRTAQRYAAPARAVFGSGISVPESVPVYRLVRARSEFDGKGYLWWVNGPDGFVDFERTTDGRGIVFTGQPGKYQLMLAVTQEGGGAQQGQAVVRIGDPPPVVVPPVIPPVVPPVVPPVIPPKPVVGKLSLMLVRETEDSTPPTARLITALRTGTSAKYLIDKGHTLSILDDDSVGPDGQPSKTVEAWRPHFAGMKLPALIIMDQATRGLIHKAEIPATATADNVIELIRQHGG